MKSHKNYLVILSTQIIMYVSYLQHDVLCSYIEESILVRQVINKNYGD